jgi:hypothetical protein
VNPPPELNALSRGQLLELVGTLWGRVTELERTNAELRAEVARLKGRKISAAGTGRSPGHAHCPVCRVAADPPRRRSRASCSERQYWRRAAIFCACASRTRIRRAGIVPEEQVERIVANSRRHNATWLRDVPRRQGDHGQLV